MNTFEMPSQPDRDLERDRDDFVRTIKSTEIASLDVDFEGGSLDDLQGEVDASGLFLLGEMHGAQENVDVIYTLFRELGFDTLALEWDKKLEEPLERFLQDGRFAFSRIQQSGDGTITAGHFALFKKLADEGLLESIVCFNAPNTGDPDQRDKAMADNLLDNLAGKRTLVVAGDIHTQTTPPARKSEGSPEHPMGEHLKRRFPDMPSGKIRYSSGKFHNYGVKDFPAPSNKQASGPRFYQGDDGVYTFELPAAQPAVVPNPGLIL